MIKPGRQGTLFVKDNSPRVVAILLPVLNEKLTNTQVYGHGRINPECASEAQSPYQQDVAARNHVLHRQDWVETFHHSSVLELADFFCEALLESRLAVGEKPLVNAAITINDQTENEIHKSESDGACPSTAADYTLNSLGRLVFAEDEATGTNEEHLSQEEEIFKSQDLVSQGLHVPLPPEQVQQELNSDDVLYQRARKYAEAAEMKGYNRELVTVYDAQCWHLIATFEAQKIYTTRAWLSTGRCVRLVQMMGLHRIDRPGSDVANILPLAKDFIELEERRRTFWASYLGDRWASICSGWPMTITESEIFTNLPTSETAFNGGKEEASISLADALADDGASRLLSSFSGVLLAVTLLGHNYTHIHQSQNSQGTQNGDDWQFWHRHQEMDNTISNTFMYLPTQFKLPRELHDPNAVFLNMTLQTSFICLHHAAIKKALKEHRNDNFVRQCIDRCITAAHAITATIRLISCHDLSKINSWTGFCPYVAGLVYCYDLKLRRPLSLDGLANLTFLLTAMKIIGKYHPITEYFTAQLELEMDAINSGRSCEQVSGHVGSFGHNLNASVTASHASERENRFWKSLSVEERATSHRRNPHPKILAGIWDNTDDGPCQNGSDVNDKSQSTACDSTSEDLPQSQEQIPQPQNPLATEDDIPSCRAESHPTKTSGVSNSEHPSRGATPEFPHTADANSYQQLVTSSQWSSPFAMSSLPYNQVHSQTRSFTSSTRHDQNYAQVQTPAKEYFGFETRASTVSEGDPVYPIRSSQQPTPLVIPTMWSMPFPAFNNTSQYQSFHRNDFGVSSYHSWNA
ncbi:uncharacterized protein PAC_18196 [Phialocephala subalpina]|uniref:Xylanolytic transcriptional activator regulatory domain-containing protein n=1 Tax=Phialocephala subalpina TaxID=576137 RepID=A0A1L7XTJ7_9HELO|nr:uncharacterized protein PAC_18196 [Phialocephala subalpina]